MPLSFVGFLNAQGIDIGNGYSVTQTGSAPDDPAAGIQKECAFSHTGSVNGNDKCGSVPGTVVPYKLLFTPEIPGIIWIFPDVAVPERFQIFQVCLAAANHDSTSVHSA